MSAAIIRSREPVPWTLTPTQRQRAIAEARRRQALNERLGLGGRNRGPAVGADALTIHLLGAAGELAVACYLGIEDLVFAEVEPRRGSFDLPPNIDVKTAARHSHSLLCLGDERPEKTLVLVTIEDRHILIHGWMRAADAMQREWWQERVPGRPCYFVPQPNLLPMSTLKARVETGAR